MWSFATVRRLRAPARPRRSQARGFLSPKRFVLPSNCQNFPLRGPKSRRQLLLQKGGLPLRKRASVLQVIWLATRSSLSVDRDAATASEGEAKAVRCDSALPPGACFFVLFQFMCQTLGSCPTRTKVRCTNSLCWVKTSRHSLVCRFFHPLWSQTSPKASIKNSYYSLHLR